MTNQPQPHERYDDEISLVDLATTLIRRRRVFYAVFAFVMIAAGTYVLLQEQLTTVTYTTTLKLAILPLLGDSESENQNMEKSRVATLIATIDSRWLPEAHEDFIKQGGEWSGGIFAEGVQDTDLVQLKTSGTNLDENAVRKMHRLLVDLLVNAQNKALNRRQELLQDQIVTMDKLIASRGADSLVAAQAIDTRTELQQKLAVSEAASVLSLANTSITESSRPSSKLVIALSVVLALLLGIFAAFVVEFGSQVRQAIYEN